MCNIKASAYYKWMSCIQCNVTTAYVFQLDDWIIYASESMTDPMLKNKDNFQQNSPKKIIK